MSLAGLDPSGGAGLLADIKTFEAHGVTGFGICTALTVQTDDALLDVQWLSAEKIIAQALPLLEKFPVRYCKIGIVANPGVLLEVLPALRSATPGLQFVLDPVLKASAGYVFHAASAGQWEAVLPQLFLLTPNYDEALALTGASCGENAAEKLSAHCAVLLKGGHRPGKEGWDTLYNGAGHTDFEPFHPPSIPGREHDSDVNAKQRIPSEGQSHRLNKNTACKLPGPAAGAMPGQVVSDERSANPTDRLNGAGSALPAYPKHGSGCVLSAAITAALANGRSLEQACREAKAYTYRYLQSHPSLLGHHKF